MRTRSSFRALDKDRTGDMLVLAFDTCWGACSAALCLAGTEEASSRKVLAASFEPMTTGHAEALPRMLATLFSETATAAGGIVRIVTPSGPGSFTGIRIAIATARALQLVSSARIFTCSSLQALAVSTTQDTGTLKRPLLVAMEARNGQTYVELFQTAIFEQGSAPQLLTYRQAAEMANSVCSGTAIDLVGTAAEKVAAEMKSPGAEINLQATAPAIDAKWLALNASVMTPQKGGLAPLYLRPPDAKPQAARAAVERLI